MSIIIQFNSSSFIPSATAVPTTASQCRPKVSSKSGMVPGNDHSNVSVMNGDENSIRKTTSNSVFATSLKEVKSFCFGLPYQDHNYGAPPPPTPPSYSPCPSPAPPVAVPDEDTNFSCVSVSTEEAKEESITRCICGFDHDDEYMICCDNCLVWQHVDCMELDRKNMPDTYLCEKCEPRKLDRHKAKVLQARKRLAMTAIKPPLIMSPVKQESKVSNANAHVILKYSRKKVPDTADMWASNQNSLNSSMFQNPPDAHYGTTDSDDCSSKNIDQKSKMRNKRKRKGSSIDHAAKKKKLYSRHLKVKFGNKRSKLKRHAKNKDSTSTADEEAQDAWEYNTTWRDDNFEDAMDNEYTPEVQHLARLISSQGYEKRFLDQLRTKQCEVQSSGNVNQLICVCDLPRNQPIIECKGKYLLASQFHENHPLYNKKLYPFVMFYNLGKNEICVDASFYGNDARFVRRSCKPNAEIRLMSYNGSLHLYLASTKVVFKDDEVTIPFPPNETNSIRDECACDSESCAFRNKKLNGDIDICHDKRRRSRQSTFSADDDDSTNSMTRASTPTDKPRTTPVEKPKASERLKAPPTEKSKVHQNKKTPNTKQKAQVEKTKMSTEKMKVPPEKPKPLADKTKIVTEKAKITIEKTKMVTEKAKMATEKNKIPTEKTKVLSEKIKIPPERLRGTSERVKILAERTKAESEKSRQSNEKAKALLDRTKASNEKVKASVEKIKTPEKVKCIEKIKTSPVKMEPLDHFQVPTDHTILNGCIESKVQSDQETDDHFMDNKKKLTREERKLDAIMRAFDQLEKAEKRRQQALERHKSHHSLKDEDYEEKPESNSDAEKMKNDETIEEKPILDAEVEVKKEEDVEEEEKPVVPPPPTPPPTPKPKKGKRRRGSGTPSKRRTRTSSGGSDILPAEELALLIPKQESSMALCTESSLTTGSLASDVSQSSTAMPSPIAASSASPVVLKTKRFLLHEWLQEKSESTVATSPVSLHTEVKLDLSTASATCYVRCTKDGPQSSGISAAHLRSNSMSGMAKPAGGAGSAKKRWLRQAMYDCSEDQTSTDLGSTENLDSGCLSPSSHADTDSPGPATEDLLTPLKKRRLMRESVESLSSPHSTDDTDTTVSNSIISNGCIDTFDQELLCNLKKLDANKILENHVGPPRDIDVECSSKEESSEPEFKEESENMESDDSKEPSNLNIQKENGFSKSDSLLPEHDITPKEACVANVDSCTSSEEPSLPDNHSVQVSPSLEDEIQATIPKQIEEIVTEAINNVEEPSDLQAPYTDTSSSVNINQKHSVTNSVLKSEEEVLSVGRESPDEVKTDKLTVNAIESTIQSFPEADQEVSPAIADSSECNELVHSKKKTNKVSHVNDKDSSKEETSELPPINDKDSSKEETNELPPLNDKDFSKEETNELPPINDKDSSKEETNELPPINEKDSSKEETKELPPIKDKNTSKEETNQLPPTDDKNTSKEETNTFSPKNKKDTTKETNELSPINAEDISKDSCADIDVSQGLDAEINEYSERCSSEEPSPSKMCASATLKRKVSLSEYRMRMRDNPSRPSVEPAKKNSLMPPTTAAMMIPDTSLEQVTLTPLPLFEAHLGTRLSPLKHQPTSQTVSTNKDVPKKEEINNTTNVEHRENLTDRLKREFGFDISDGPPKLSFLNQTKVKSNNHQVPPAVTNFHQMPPPPPPPRQPRPPPPVAQTQFAYTARPYPVRQPQFIVPQVPQVAPYMNMPPPPAIPAPMLPPPVHQINPRLPPIGVRPPMLPSTHQFAPPVHGTLMPTPEPQKYAQPYIAPMVQNTYPHVYSSGLYK